MNETSLASASVLGVIVSLVTRFIVLSPRFPWIDEQHVGKIKAVAALLSAMSGLLVAASNKELQENDVMLLVDAAVVAVNTLGISALIHHWFIKTKPDKPKE